MAPASRALSFSTTRQMLKHLLDTEVSLNFEPEGEPDAGPTYQVSGRDSSVPDQFAELLNGPRAGLLSSSWSCEGNRIAAPTEWTDPLPGFAPGATGTMPQSGQPLAIITLAGQGHRAKVYKAQAQDTGELFALKVIHRPTRQNLLSIAQEALKSRVLLEHQIPCAEVLESGTDYVLKKWVDGQLGDDWLQAQSSGVFDREHLSALMAFYKHSAENRVAIENLKPANMMLNTDGIWIPIDPGRISVGQSRQLSFSVYRRSFVSKWLGTKPYSLRYLFARLLAGE